MDRRNLRLRSCLEAVWHVARSSICVSGKDMAILRIVGLMRVIWVMLGSWLLSLSVGRPCLGSQGPEGGVVLGFDTTTVQFGHI